MAKTSTSALGAASAELQAGAQRLKIWRATRRAGQRIPEDLWQAAMDLARIHGLSRTATALKLSYYDLRRRLQAGAARDNRRRRPPMFVEVPPMPLPPGGGERGTVELVTASGARLILRVPDVDSAELLPVVELFLRHARSRSPRRCAFSWRSSRSISVKASMD